MKKTPQKSLANYLDDEVIDSNSLRTIKTQHDNDPRNNESPSIGDLRSKPYDSIDTMLFPTPNPLRDKCDIYEEPLRHMYKFPFKEMQAFKGKELEEIPYKHNNQVFIPCVKTYSSNDKLRDIFKSSENIVYKRNNYLDQFEAFNTNYCEYKHPMKKLHKKFTRLDSSRTELESSIDNLVNSHHYHQLQQLKNPHHHHQQQQQQSFHYHNQAIPKDKTLIFESRFESGNLAMALKVTDNEYDLLLQSDTNNIKYVQWFFFQIRNTTKGLNVKFNILNYIKTDSLYNHGMKILIYSKKEYEEDRIGWFRGGKNIIYGSNGIPREDCKNRTYKTLSFEYEFNHDDDEIYFAYCYPYTYTDLATYLNNLEKNAKISAYFGRTLLCRTLAGNKCEFITITNNYFPGHLQSKKCIVLTGRVHPGETNSSYILKGIIDFLTSSQDEANMLREKFIFKIIPMLNPDGVIHGNYRCSLSGRDLNRRWRNPSEAYNPVIYSAKQLIQQWHEEYKVVFFCDFHGHSNKKNTFIYGCDHHTQPFKSREFPYIFSKLCPAFSFKDSTFGVEEYKKHTARIVLWETLGINNSYTLESSFFGSEGTNLHYTIKDLEHIGKQFCLSLLTYYSDDVKKEKIIQTININSNSNITSASTSNYSSHSVFVTEAQIRLNENIEKIKNNIIKELYLNLGDPDEVIRKETTQPSDSEASEGEDDEDEQDDEMKIKAQKNKSKNSKKKGPTRKGSMPKLTNSITPAKTPILLIKPGKKSITPIPCTILDLESTPLVQKRVENQKRVLSVRRQRPALNPSNIDNIGDSIKNINSNSIYSSRIEPQKPGIILLKQRNTQHLTQLETTIINIAPFVGDVIINPQKDKVMVMKEANPGRNSFRASQTLKMKKPVVNQENVINSGHIESPKKEKKNINGNDKDFYSLYNPYKPLNIAQARTDPSSHQSSFAEMIAFKEKQLKHEERLIDTDFSLQDRNSKKKIKQRPEDLLDPTRSNGLDTDTWRSPSAKKKSNLHRLKLADSVILERKKSIRSTTPLNALSEKKSIAENIRNILEGKSYCASNEKKSNSKLLTELTRKHLRSLARHKKPFIPLMEAQMP